MAQKKSPPSREKKKYHIEMTSLSMFFWVFCLCFLLTWVFVLGVLVGRGFLPSAVSTISDLKAQVARLQSLVPHGKSSNPVPQRSAESDPKLAFYDKLSSKKEEVKRKGPQEEKSVTPKGESPHARSEAPKGAKGEAAKPESAVPAKKPPELGAASSNSLQFTVQLASLEDRGKAESTIRQLKDRGFDAYFYEVKVKGKTFYRVRCGKFRTREDAELHGKKLTEQAGISGFVTKVD